MVDTTNIDFNSPIDKEIYEYCKTQIENDTLYILDYVFSYVNNTIDPDYDTMILHLLLFLNNITD